MMSFWCCSCSLWLYFTPFSSVSIVDFEKVNVIFLPFKCQPHKKAKHANNSLATADELFVCV